jgi:uncharacterized protein (DUF1800 family)
MLATTDKPLMAHLLRRAGFGATYEELETCCAKGYETTVEELLHPELQPAIEEDLLERYYIDWKESRNIEGALTEFVYRMNASQRPLQEKMALFWHGLFATALSKVLHEKTMLNQIDMFRTYGLGSFRELLVQLAKDPAMIFWLDNNVNHKDAPNENWGRELLELFSMGVGNYTEEDVKAAARAFTGWTIDDDNTASIPFGKIPWAFRYLPEDHDDSAKNFLGHTGRFNGEDVIDIIVRNPATARFVARKLYNFFVSDEPDQAAENILADAYMQYHYDIRLVLRVLFNSNFFKSEKARFAKVKSPAEVVVGTLHLLGDFKFPRLGIFEVALESRYMGQDLLNPPSVEGWHTGKEWIDSGSLVGRINFVADQIGNINKPGIRAMVEALLSRGPVLTPEAVVDGGAELMGYVRLNGNTRQQLLQQVRKDGEVRTDTPEKRLAAEEVVLRTLKMIGSTREYQFA